MINKTLLNNRVLFGIYIIVLHFNRVNLAYNPACWLLNVVPYTIDHGFSIWEYNFLHHQMARINKNTCIIWEDMYKSVPLQNLTSFVRFKKATNFTCETIVYNPLKVEITLSDECFQGKHVIHEIVHALGFPHEHQRADRDCYVWVSDTAKNAYYEKMPSFPRLDEFPYDKTSVMHYRRSIEMKAHSERSYEWEPLGTNDGILTELDIWKIQYRFCGRPHYCDVNPEHCILMENMESEMNCVQKT